VAIGQQQAGVDQDDTATEQQAPSSENASAAAFERLETAIASEPVIRPQAEPFGLDAEPVRTGAILAKWDGVEAQIQVEDRVLARCRAGGSWCPWAARRLLTIVADGRTRIPQRDVRLVVVRNNAAGQQHAVVAVRLDGDWVILDNRWLAMVRDREMWRATPLFELDDSGVRRFLAATPASRLVESAADPDHLVSASYTPSQPGPGGSAR